MHAGGVTRWCGVRVVGVGRVFIHAWRGSTPHPCLAWSGQMDSHPRVAGMHRPHPSVAWTGQREPHPRVARIDRIQPGGVTRWCGAVCTWSGWVGCSSTHGVDLRLIPAWRSPARWIPIHAWRGSTGFNLVVPRAGAVRRARGQGGSGVHPRMAWIYALSVLGVDRPAGFPSTRGVDAPASSVLGVVRPDGFPSTRGGDAPASSVLAWTGYRDPHPRVDAPATAVRGVGGHLPPATWT